MGLSDDPEYWIVICWDCGKRSMIENFRGLRVLAPPLLSQLHLIRLKEKQDMRGWSQDLDV